MRANDPDVVVVDAGVAGASIAAVLARGGSEVLLLSWPAPLAQRGVHRPASRIAAGFMAVPTASIGIPRAVSAHAVTSAPKRQICSPRARLSAVMPLARNRQGECGLCFRRGDLSSGGSGRQVTLRDRTPRLRARWKRCFVERLNRSTAEDQQTMFSLVGRLGLEPRTHGLKEDRWGAKNALPAQMSLLCTRKAPIAQGCDRCSSHESFHGLGGAPGRFGH
jgi:glycine/D-amino acid oxidase-like deaminating enzyme